MLKFLVRQQKIEILEREVIASDQISFVTLKFIFEGDWKNFHKVVQFTQDDETYNRVLGFDGTEQAWLESLKGESGKNGIDGNSPDLSEYVKTTDVENLIAENLHTHHNFAIWQAFSLQFCVQDMEKLHRKKTEN